MLSTTLRIYVQKPSSPPSSMSMRHRHLSLRHRHPPIPLAQSTPAVVSQRTITLTSPVDKMAGQPHPNPLWLYQLELMAYHWLFLVEFDHSWASRSRSSDSASVWSIETTAGSITSDSEVESNGTTQSVDSSNTSSSDNESH